MSKDKDKDNQDQAWMHYSGAKQGYEKMMQGAPDIKDHTFNFGRPGERADEINHEAYGKAQANFAARAASGAWMMDTVGKLGVDKDGEPNYRHPHLAALAKKGYTFDQIQQAGNNLGIKSFNREEDGAAIDEYLQNLYNPEEAEDKDKEEDDGSVETTPEEQERYDAIQKRLQAREDYQIGQQEKGMQPLDRYASKRDFSEFSDRESYDARNKTAGDEDMRDEAKDPEAVNFLNVKKKDTINRMRADEASRA